MPQQPHTWQRAAAAGSTHRAEEHLSDHLGELQRLLIVEPVRVHDLSHHFEGRLCAKLLLHRHVEVIDKDEQVVVGILGAVDSFLVLLEPALGVALDLLRG